MDPNQRRLVLELADERPAQFHSWMLRAANRLKLAGMKEREVFMVVRDFARGHSRSVPKHEIEAAVSKAFLTDYRSGEDLAPGRSGFAGLDSEAKLKVLQASADWPAGYGLEELCRDAPSGLGSFRSMRSEWLLNLLFWFQARQPGDSPSFLCVGAPCESGSGYRSSVLGIGRVSEVMLPEWANLVVPNLAVAESGLTSEGKESSRAKEMFPVRHYVVLESDLGPGTEDIQAALIRFTGKVLKRRPVMVVHSGSKSLHSWWSMKGLTERDVIGFIDQMAGLFDPAAKSRNQLFRMPNASRGRMEKSNPGVLQSVLFFDPDAVVAGRPFPFRGD